ncbi:MAG: hypothetical protein JWM36_4585 [Hyphomicrobiales bacterium]|nr:hypothetical protein [Hyphomicrobiales bacterium]
MRDASRADRFVRSKANVQTLKKRPIYEPFVRDGLFSNALTRLVARNSPHSTSLDKSEATSTLVNANEPLSLFGTLKSDDVPAARPVPSVKVIKPPSAA